MYTDAPLFRHEKAHEGALFIGRMDACESDAPGVFGKGQGRLHWYIHRQVSVAAQEEDLPQETFLRALRRLRAAANSLL